MAKPIHFDTSYQTFIGAPRLQDHGLHSASMVSLWGLFDGDDYSRISYDACRRVANHPTWWSGRESDMIVLDCEVIPLHASSRTERDAAHDQLIEAVKIYREAHPGNAIGYYSELPQLDFYGSLGNCGHQMWVHYKPHYENWVRNNKQFLYNYDDNIRTNNKGLAAVVDRVFPSVYPNAAHKDWSDWMQWWMVVLDGNVEQAEQYQKPIYVYLSPQWDGRSEYLQPGRWKQMLEYTLANKSVDGVVVYQSVAVGTVFDSSAAWWKETLEVRNVKD